MDLTPDQIAAARACGCVLTMATEDQVRRLSMQRRVFHVGGEPFVAAREGFFETHGTLAALIEKHRPTAAVSDAEPEAARVPERAMPGDAETSVATSGAPAPEGPEEVRAGQNGRRAAAARPRKARAPWTEPAPAHADTAPVDETAAGPSEAEKTLAGVAAAQGRALGARVVGRVRRVGKPLTPRWMVAGKMRRGRLK